jgi:hypothetical protein
MPSAEDLKNKKVTLQQINTKKLVTNVPMGLQNGKHLL